MQWEAPLVNYCPSKAQNEVISLIIQPNSKITGSFYGDLCEAQGLLMGSAIESEGGLALAKI